MTEYTSWNDTPTISYAKEGDTFTALSTGKVYVYKDKKWVPKEEPKVSADPVVEPKSTPKATTKKKKTKKE